MRDAVLRRRWMSCTIDHVRPWLGFRMYLVRLGWGWMCLLEDWMCGVSVLDAVELSHIQIINSLLESTPVYEAPSLN